MKREDSLGRDYKSANAFESGRLRRKLTAEQARAQAQAQQAGKGKKRPSM